MRTIHITKTELPYVWQSLLGVIDLAISNPNYSKEEDGNNIQNVINIFKQTLPKTEKELADLSESE